MFLNLCNGIERMFRNLIILCICLVAVIGCGNSGEGTSEKNCDDFSTQREAQSYFEAYNASDLDRDNDGIACESLPKNNQREQLLTSYIGSYILIGMSCDTEKECIPSSIELDVNSENSISYCINDSIYSSCDVKNFTSKFEFINNALELPNGSFTLNNEENGHVIFKINNDKYYGHNILETDFSNNGSYLSNGILIGNRNISVSSISGQVISWNVETGLNNSSD